MLWYISLYLLIGFLYILFIDWISQTIQGKNGATYFQYILTIVVWPIIIVLMISLFWSERVAGKVVFSFKKKQKQE